MSLTEVNGLPAHVLFVHFVIVLVPLTALALIACAVWPNAARRIGILLPVLGFVTLASVPLATHAGEWLQDHVQSSPLIREHAEMGDGMLPWALALFLLTAAVWWVARRAAANGGAVSVAVPIRVAAAALSVAVAAGAVVEVYRIGDSGARAAWTGSFSQTPLHQDGGDHDNG